MINVEFLLCKLPEKKKVLLLKIMVLSLTVKLLDDTHSTILSREIPSIVTTVFTLIKLIAKTTAERESCFALKHLNLFNCQN